MILLLPVAEMQASVVQGIVSELGCVVKEEKQLLVGHSVVYFRFLCQAPLGKIQPILSPYPHWQ